MKEGREGGKRGREERWGGIEDGRVEEEGEWRWRKRGIMEEGVYLLSI